METSKKCTSPECLPVGWAGACSSKSFCVENMFMGVILRASGRQYSGLKSARVVGATAGEGAAVVCALSVAAGLPARLQPD